MKIQVCYAQMPKAVCIEIEVEPGTVVVDAIEDSGIIEQCGIHLENCKVGIHSHFVELTHVLQEGDRIEIYTPATATEKHKRALV